MKIRYASKQNESTSIAKKKTCETLDSSAYKKTNTHPIDTIELLHQTNDQDGKLREAHADKELGRGAQRADLAKNVDALCGEPGRGGRAARGV